MRFVDLTGHTFGRLTVMHRHEENDPQGKPRWVCSCSCGQTTVVRRADLRNGRTKSCGCLMAESRLHRTRKHGCSRVKQVSSEYYTWQAMKRRCLDPNNKCFHLYGGRGIAVCDRWMNSFSNFLLDMGPRPFKGAHIDRVDSEKGYSLENCRWATPQQNARNKRNTLKVCYNGVVESVCELADRVGLNPDAVRRRLRRGWSVERALEQPKRKAPTKK